MWLQLWLQPLLSILIRIYFDLFFFFLFLFQHSWLCLIHMYLVHIHSSHRETSSIRRVQSGLCHNTLRNLVTGKESDYHIQLLKPFIFDERVTDPLEIAIQEDDGYIVDEILQHRHLRGNKGPYEYLVRWTGYQDTSWEPLKMIQRVGKFHEYARKHRLIRFIPKALR